MAQDIRENGWKIKFTGSVFTLGLMVGAMKGNGVKTIWKVWASTSGTTGGLTKGNTWTIRNMDTAYIDGPTEDNTRATGT